MTITGVMVGDLACSVDRCVATPKKIQSLKARSELAEHSQSLTNSEHIFADSTASIVWRSMKTGTDLDFQHKSRYI